MRWARYTSSRSVGTDSERLNMQNEDTGCRESPKTSTKSTRGCADSGWCGSNCWRKANNNSWVAQRVKAQIPLSSPDGKVGSVPSRLLAQGRCGWIPPSYSTWLRNLHQQGHVTKRSRPTVPTGPNDGDTIVWPIGKFFFFFLVLFQY